MNDDVQHAAHLAALRNALGGYLLHLRASGVDVDSVTVTVNEEGQCECEGTRAGLPVFGEGA